MDSRGSDTRFSIWLWQRETSVGVQLMPMGCFCLFWIRKPRLFVSLGQLPREDLQRAPFTSRPLGNPGPLTPYMLPIPPTLSVMRPASDLYLPPYSCPWQISYPVGGWTLPGQVVLKSSSPQVKKSSGYLVLIEHSSSSSIQVDNFSQGDKRTG